jgi:hypothetical protein
VPTYRRIKIAPVLRGCIAGRECTVRAVHCGSRGLICPLPNSPHHCDLSPFVEMVQSKRGLHLTARSALLETDNLGWRVLRYRPYKVASFLFVEGIADYLNLTKHKYSQDAVAFLRSRSMQCEFLEKYLSIQFCFLR